jgi:deoxyribose-phosphate aldolase
MTAAPKSRSELARLIDHTILKPETTAGDVDRLCDECLKYGFFSACVNPTWVSRCVERLVGSNVAVASVAGFPLGATTPEVKAYEALLGVEAGASEIDMVVNVAALLAGDVRQVVRDIHCVVETTKASDAVILVKVILETRVLTDEQIILGCRCAGDAGADFVKTSTGFHPAGGACVEHVRLMKQHAGGMRVKASGGIRDLPTSLALLAAGADRLGMSASVAVLEAMPT